MNILIFDTETTGLDEHWNDILQLSWQVIDGETFRAIRTRNHFFPYPENRARVNDQAIAINGLTEEFLATQQLSSRKDALEQFKKDMDDCLEYVGHNIKFDVKFLRAAAQREGLRDFVISDFRCHDTMTSSTNLCQIPFPNGRPGYKWPKLSELADYLGISTNDITLHDSRGDVELTRRCYMELCRRGVFCHSEVNHSENEFSVQAEVKDSGKIEMICLDTKNRPVTNPDIIEKIKKHEVWKGLVKESANEFIITKDEERIERMNVQRIAPLVMTLDQVQEELAELRKTSYTEKQFDLPMPSNEEIRRKVEAEAQSEVSSIFFWTNAKKRVTYVEENLPKRIIEFQTRWNEQKRRHEETEAELKAAFDAERDAKIKTLESTISPSAEEISKKLNLLKSCKVGDGWLTCIFDYDEANHKILADVLLPELNALPTEKLGKLIGDHLEMKPLTEKEKKEQYAIYSCGAVIYLAASLLNLSVDMKMVDVKAHTIRPKTSGEMTDDYVIMASISRDQYRNIDYLSCDSIEALEMFPHTFEITSTYLFKALKNPK